MFSYVAVTRTIVVTLCTIPARGLFLSISGGGCLCVCAGLASFLRMHRARSGASGGRGVSVGYCVVLAGVHTVANKTLVSPFRVGVVCLLVCGRFKSSCGFISLYCWRILARWPRWER